MKIDRARFVLLTATIAASTAAAVVMGTGCSSTSTKDSDAGTNTNADSGSPTDSGNADGSSTTDASDAAAACLADQATRTAVCGASDDGGADDAGDDAGDGGSGTKCAAECGYLFDKYKGDVAKNIHACLTIAPTCEEDPANCIGAAIDKACPDPTAEGQCSALLPGCADAAGVPTMAECMRAITPLNETGKASFVSCMTEGVDCGGCIYLATKSIY